MSPDNPFLKALLADPDDDTLRLALADWLDENDDAPRAEFIRVQIELARGVEDSNRRRQLEIRQRDLLIAHEAEWVRPLADVIRCRHGKWGGWVFRRGFVEYFHVSGTVINRCGDRLAELTPICELLLRPCAEQDIVTLCTRSWLQSVTGLYLRAVTLSGTTARALMQCPYLDRLRKLDVILGEMDNGTQRAFTKRFASILGSG